MMPYHDRRTWLIGVRDLADWKLKIYGISSSGEDLSEQVIEAAWQQARTCVPNNAPQTSPYGFITLHAGADAVWLLVDLWFNDILHHFLFRAPLKDPTRWESPSDDPTISPGIMACAWELEVIQHERNAWVRHVLSDPSKPGFEAYMGEHLHIVGTPPQLMC